MIDNIIAFSIRNKLIIGIFTLALVIWGLFSLSRLPIDAVPDITNNQVQIITTSPTLAAQEVEQFITFPIEMEMANVPNLVEIRSISRFGLSVVTVVFEDKVDIYLARQIVGEKLQSAQEQIPNGLGSPEMGPVSTGLGEIYQYVLHTTPDSPKKYTPTELRTIQDWIVKRQLAGTPGVAEVSSFGGILKQYQVSVDPNKLRAFDLTLADIFRALEQNNQNTGGAFIEKGPNAYFIRGLGLLKNFDDIEQIIIKNTEGLPLLIRDVATVEEGSAVRYGALTRNGEGEVVGGIVLMLKGENSAQVIQNVKVKVAAIQKTLPPGVVLEPFLDRTRLVDRAIGTVSKNLIEGGLIVIFVLVILLGNLRAGLVVASVIPLAMLFAIAMMQLFGVSGNLMSLGAIDFGLIVDGAVIIVESIVHRIAVNKQFVGVDRLNQRQMDDVVLDATVKIRQSAAFGEIIILIVYLPILALVGIEGKMFRPMAQTVGFAILGALILSLTYVPMASALFLSKKTKHKPSFADKMMGRLETIYARLLQRALKLRVLLLALTLGLFLITLFLFSRMGGEFIPTLDEGDFAIESSISSGSSLTQSVKTFSQAEKILLKQFPEVKEVISKIGASEIPTDPMPIEAADMTVILKDRDEWVSADSREELMEKMEEALSVIPGLNAEFSQPIQLRSNELMTGVKQDIAVKIYGEDLAVLAQKAEEAANLIRPIAGVGDLKVEQTTGLPQIMVQYNRAQMAQMGVSVEDVNQALRTGFAGGVAGVIFEKERRFDLVVRLNEASRQNIANVEDLLIALPNGSQIPLRQVAQVTLEEGPMQISRDDTKRRITIGINARERDVENLVKDIQTTLDAQFKLPVGYYVTYGGQFENLQAAKARLSVAVPLSLATILILLFFTFNSFKQSLLIFTAIPLAAIGGVFALLLRGMPFSISAGIGFIALFGVAVLNGIVLIGYFNQLKQEGLTDPFARIMEGTKVRLRPVIMTAAVASLGFLPMALSNSAGAEVQKPLATVVIGGLITSTLLTLFLLPILYSYVEKMKKPQNLSSTGGQVALVLFFLLAGSLALPAQAQISQSPTGNPITVNQAVDLALQNSPAVRAGTLMVKQQQALRRTSFDLPKTMVTGAYGQMNSAANDNALSLSQNFSLPGVYRSQARLAAQQVSGAELQLQQTRRTVVRDVKLAFNEWAVLTQREKTLVAQDSLAQQFERAAGLRFKTGEANYLEKIAAEAQAMEARTELTATRAEVAIVRQRLLRSLFVTDTVNFRPELRPATLTLPTDTTWLSNHPEVAYYKNQVAVSQAQTQVERSQLWPDFSLGVTSQTIQGFQNITGTEQFYGMGQRFHSVEVGVGIPIVSRAQRARVQAARLQTQVAAAQYQNQRLLLQTELQGLSQEYARHQQTLRYYEEKALPQASLIIEYATKGFRLGETPYTEYIQNIAQAQRIRLQYLEVVSQFNQAVIQLEYHLKNN
ncbi:acriflavine resistance protein B [Adhaeribacter aerolatus]|uniref:Acriflavine resistance protein B n=1 Tax=Adhaeribacter aerolatus TaxID=670289 RepID=A0A512B0K2_9BACT|nr:CusA/CzcA family heavy metal efflux RND transporter [Adhaeribacter aerolatus]GEO05484.1 acriflavine resistance protein B [Adhaeribacter aerolatus]